MLLRIRSTSKKIQKTIYNDLHCGHKRERGREVKKREKAGEGTLAIKTALFVLYITV